MNSTESDAFSLEYLVSSEVIQLLMKGVLKTRQVTHTRIIARRQI